MPFRQKLKDVCLKRVFSLLGIPYHLSHDERSLHFGLHCTMFTREKSRWLTYHINTQTARFSLPTGRKHDSTTEVHSFILYFP